MRDAAQRGLDAAEHDGQPGKRLPAEVRVDDGRAVRAASRSARRASTDRPTRIFFCAVRRLSIESRLPALIPTKSRGRPMREESLGVLPRGLRDEPDLEAAALEKARDEHRPERGVVDVGVAGDDEDVELVASPGASISSRVVGKNVVRSPARGPSFAVRSCTRGCCMGTAV